MLLNAQRIVILYLTGCCYGWRLLHGVHGVVSGLVSLKLFPPLLARLVLLAMLLVDTVKAPSREGDEENE